MLKIHRPIACLVEAIILKFSIFIMLIIRSATTLNAFLYDCGSNADSANILPSVCSGSGLYTYDPFGARISS